MNKHFDVVVIGAGAAGLLAAGTASRRGLKVAVVTGSKPAAKVRITGKGRCNVTNACTPDEFLQNVVTNPKFLYGAINAFTPYDTASFFEELGVPLKTERGGRVFPQSDSAGDIARALTDYAKKGCAFIDGRVESLTIKNAEIKGVTLADGAALDCGAVLVATGGMSYPRTGSTGDGYALARSAGHSTVEPVAALCPIICRGDFSALEGLSLKNVELVCRRGKKTIFCQRGELLFTSEGISGPLVLTLSSHINRVNLAELELYIDLKPALDEKTLDARLVRDFSENLNRELKNSLGKLLPKSLVLPLIEKSGVPPTQKINSLTQNSRHALVSTLKHFSLEPVRLAPIDEAIVTAGGVDVRQVNPKTMESKLVRGLFFAGEVLDVDALTGGYNLQTAFSTAKCAGNNIGRTQMKAIAIDGPAGAGKSSLARRLAGDLGYIYADTGALYRAVGLYALRAGVAPRDEDAVREMLRGVNVDLGFVEGKQRVFLNGEDVSDKIRTEDVSMAASAVSSLAIVREFLMDLQRNLAKHHNVIMDGRDIGTVVLPDADVKIFLTADAAERAKRRYDELIKKGVEADYATVLADLQKRDYDDSHRAVCPLRPADGAIVVDTTGNTLEQSLEHLGNIVKERL